jgi:hypothetical protein
MLSEACSFTNQELEMRKIIASLMTAATLLTALPAGAETFRTRTLPDVQQAYPNESYSQYYYRRGYDRPYYRHHYRRGGGGDAVAAGVVGLAAGALIAGAIASQAQAQPVPPRPPGTVDPNVAAYCARKYRSYDSFTGTYLATNGMRYVCTYP